MSAVIVYESMFGSTRAVAEALARGIAKHASVSVVNVNHAGGVFPDADLLLVGGPTHVHGMSSPATRTEAGRWTEDPDKGLTLEKSAPGIGVREWLDTATGRVGEFVAFDTRANGAPLLTGSAAKHIRKALAKAGGHEFAVIESFVVHENQVAPEELTRAEAAGETIGARLLTNAGTGHGLS